MSVSFEYAERLELDPFSEYRSGFEICTRRRCTRIVVRTHADKDQEVRSYDFIYFDQRPELKTVLPINGVSLLSQVKVTGHDGNKTETLPPLEFNYTRFEPQKRDFFPLQGSDLPARSLASKGKLTTEYHYHHGHWDGAEREFRGFGMVEQLDTESFEKYDSTGLHGAEGVVCQSRSAILLPAHPQQDLVSSGAGR